ncbi:MAG: bifunctional (p)ppGpp synthetase/guanosine-3',5'-bis(diphosphate) 3'-pyrophosphohydrolase [Raineya sp.]|nr:bifunctional (p)ppGpp synthetase/guanosine-3',5'-bis(diphosphate) 3'-pyrophosphohydrolase [Raineya sp.]MDW8295443.1 bifunctional (p)ppGpp synthetase/guanosine-3',5'-bis(diphosphate) 3'-pyrophosphohydrolase [Raineya sp.]
MIAMNEDALEQERKEILKRYRRLLRLAKPYLKDGDAKLIKKAFHLSAEAHKDMRRKSGEPYIYHPLAVAQICVEEIGLGTTAIVAALLHDVVEDTHITLAEIEKQFGKKIAKIIDGLTKISNITDSNSISVQAENFRKVLLTLAEDVRVILIKIADRLHNMRTLADMPRNKQLKIAYETSYLYAPLAHRLGLYTIKSELEDLYLKYTETEVYEEIARKLQATKAAREKFIKDFIAPIEKALKQEGFNFVIKGRPKSIYSIYSKMKKQQIPFEKIYDLFAIRIILDDIPFEEEKAACWKVYSIITDYYRPSPERLRDWISTPRANGYESLHTTVMSTTGQWVEVQIRTRRMDDIAEKGYAAHWKYKETGVTKAQTQESGLEIWLNKVRDMLENQDATTIEFLDEFRSNLFSDEVFVFTPKGDLKVLPQGATALDFAFEIHSEVGNKCIGAKVNNKLVPISYKLQNGDQVEILTSAKQTPSEDWLRLVVTSKAKSKIREALRDEKRKYIKRGKEIVDKKLHQFGIEPNDNVYNDIRALFNDKSVADLFYRFGKEYIQASELKKYKEIVQKRRNSTRENIKDVKTFEKVIQKIHPDQKDVLLIGEDMDKIDYKLATCCNPIPGDDVFGFVTVNEGIKIHRTNCPNAAELMSHYGHRILKAQWASKIEDSYMVALRITGTDRVGIINDVTKIISNELKVNMRSMAFDTIENVFEGNCTVLVHDTRHLNLLIEKLKQVPGVEQVVRYDS